jgi:hypothetical protein
MTCCNLLLVSCTLQVFEARILLSLFLLHETRLSYTVSYTVFEASLSTGVEKKFGSICRRKFVEIVVVTCTNGRTIINLCFLKHTFDIP